MRTEVNQKEATTKLSGLMALYALIDLLTFESYTSSILVLVPTQFVVLIGIVRERRQIIITIKKNMFLFYNIYPARDIPSVVKLHHNRV